MFPLTKRTPHPLLPLAGKPILIHALEVLHRSSIRRVDVVSPDLYEQLEFEIDTGTFLGMTIRFMPTVPNLQNERQHCLIVGLSDIVDADWSDILDDVFGDLQVTTRIPVKMTVSAIPVALLVPPHFGSEVLTWGSFESLYKHGENDDKISCDWSEMYRTEAIQVPICPNYLISTSSLDDYYHANFNLLHNKFNYVKPAGRKLVSGHLSAPKAHVNICSIQSKYGYFGSHCRIDKSVRLYGDVIIGDSAVIDKGARISDSIICDRTYIGSNIDCRNSIVNGNCMIRMDTGVCLEIDDPVLFSAIN